MEYSALDSAPSQLMAKRIIASVINDLSTDQRMHKICSALSEMGFDVTLVGRELNGSLPLNLPFSSHRMKLKISRGPLFYLEYNLRLFFYLLEMRPDIYLANDLDTLLANYLAYANTKETELVYDSHEYFTEVPEIQGRWVKKVWMKLEEWIFPKLKHVYTVNRSIADIYRSKYKVPVSVVRNVPELKGVEKEKNRAELGLPADKKIIIIQGAGINVDRGGEELVESMRYLPTEYYLVVVGAGDRIAEMKALSQEHGLDGRIRFEGRMPYKEMMQYTFNADLGVSLDNGTSGNYIYALPNKVMDYVAAGLMLLVSDMHEVRNFVQDYNLGMVVNDLSPIQLASSIESMFADEQQIATWKANAIEARKSLNWDKEKEELQRIFQPLA